MDVDEDAMRAMFYKRLNESLRHKNENNFYLTREKYAALLEEVKESKRVKVKQAVHYRRLRRYDILHIRGQEKLISPEVTDCGDVLYFACFDELFDIIHEKHVAAGHAGRNRMRKKLASKYKNVTTEAIGTYLRLCVICQRKLKKLKKDLAIVQTKQPKALCELGFIDMQSNPDGDMNFIFLYQENLTKFVLVRALRSQTVDEVSQNLLEVFSTFGAPHVLHCDSGKEFCDGINNLFSRMWDGIEVVHSSPRGQWQESVQDKLAMWMYSNGRTTWSEGVRYVQVVMNQAYQEEINRSPYEAMFRVPWKLGITSLKDLSTNPRRTKRKKVSEEPLSSEAGQSTKTAQMQPITIFNVGENAKGSEFPKQVKLEVSESEDEDISLSTTCVNMEMKDDDEYDIKCFLPEELHISDVATTDLASNSSLAGGDVNSKFGEYVAESLNALTHQFSRVRLKTLIKEAIKHVTESDQLLRSVNSYMCDVT